MASSSCMPSGRDAIWSNSAAALAQPLRITCSSACASASRCAAGGTVPGCLRAWLRTKAAARAMASAAMPHHSEAHRMCEYGTMVCADDSANAPGRICSTPADATNFAPGLQVPRMPSVSQPVVGVSV